MKLCTICARGGSKGVPGKNIRLLGGLPLIAHSIRHARESGLFVAIVISSDSDEILALSKAHGADILIKRPDELATDESGKIPAIVHAVQSAEALQNMRYSVVVDLAATSPLRLPSDIVASVELLEDARCTSVITGSIAHCSPYFSLVERNEKGVVHVSKALPRAILRRQDSPPCFDMNGSIYVWNRDRFLANPSVFYDDTRLWEMPRERSVDIDEELDFAIAELILQRSQQRGN